MPDQEAHNTSDIFDWLKSDQVRMGRQESAFSVTQLLDLPADVRELMLEINRSEPVSLAELARILDRNPTELEIQLSQLVAQGWLDMQEDEFGEWVYQVKLGRSRKRVLPPGIWQVLDNRWQVPIFRLFPEAALEDFTQRFQLEHYREGTTLFRWSEWGERMYIIDSGVVQLLVHNDEGQSFVIKEVTSGDVFGEMSVLLGERRPYTALVVQEASIWVLDKSDLDYLIAQHPAIGLAIRRELAHQTKPAAQQDVQDQHNPIVAVGEGSSELACYLARQIGDPVVLIDLIGKTPDCEDNLTYVDARAMRSKAIAELIQAKIAEQAWVIVASFAQMTDQLMRVTGMAEVVVDMTGSGAPWLRAASRRYWSAPSGTPLHLARLARRLCGRITGLVLSGGAARTIAHLGVLDVLSKNNIQFDVIASCGYGAFWGTLYAAGWSVEELIDLAVNQVAKLQPFGGWLGLRSTAKSGLFDIRAVRNLIRTTLGNTKFTDLKTPCHLVSSDLVTGETVWINQDALFPALSACVATPGLVTPVEHQERLLVDAILTNPLPADAVAAQGTDIVLASSVIPAPGARQKKKEMQREQNLVTSWFDVCDIVAHERALDHLSAIDLIMAPDVAEFSDTDFDQAQQLIEKGRQAAEKALPRIQSLLRSKPREKDSDHR